MYLDLLSDSYLNSPLTSDELVKFIKESERLFQYTPCSEYIELLMFTNGFQYDNSFIDNIEEFIFSNIEAQKEHSNKDFITFGNEGNMLSYVYNKKDDTFNVVGFFDWNEKPCRSLKTFSELITCIVKGEQLLSELDIFIKEFNTIHKGEFLLNLTDTPKKLKHLKKIGFTSNDILRLKNKRLPEGYNVHHKLPYDGGGTNDFLNFVLIQEDPYRRLILNSLNESVKNLIAGEKASIELPIPEGSIYPLLKE